MFDNGPEFGAPDEGTGGGGDQVSEAAREQAAQRFAASQQAAQAQQRDEKRAKKRDTGVAQIILQFLTDTQRMNLATLIARLVAIDCPSPFILAILSLINDGCRSAVDDYLGEKQTAIDATAAQSRSIIPDGAGLPTETNELLIEWIMRIEAVLETDPQAVLKALIVDQNNIDGTVLQLTTFCLQIFLAEHGKNAAFESLQEVAVGVLQPVFLPHMQAHAEMLHAKKLEDEQKKGEWEE